jgi:hypothetical protein
MDTEWMAWNQAALQRLWGMTNHTTVNKMERFDDVKNNQHKTKRTEPKWRPSIAPPLPITPCHIEDAADPYALDAMMVNGNHVMACEDDLWDYTMKVS